MTLDLVILVAAIAISWIVFGWLLRILKASLSTAFLIAIIVLILQLVFGIGPEDLWHYLLSFYNKIGFWLRDFTKSITALI